MKEQRMKIINLLRDRIFRNFSWLFADKIVRMGLGLVVGVWVTRYLGPANYGILSYISAIIAMFTFVAQLGLDTVVVKELVDKRFPKECLIGTVFWLKMAGGVLAYFLIVGVAALADVGTYITGLLMISAFSVIARSIEVIDLWFQSQTLSKYIVLSNTIAAIICSFVKIACVLFEQTLSAFVIIGVIEILIAKCFYIFYYKKTKNQFSFAISIECAKCLMSQSWPLMISSMLVTIYIYIDQVMLQRLMGEKEVGIYAVGIKFSEIFYFIPMCVLSSIQPKMVALYKENRKYFEESLQKIFSFASLFSYLVMIFIWMIAPTLIGLLYGLEYLDSADILRIHIFAFVFVFYGVLRSLYLLVEGKNRLSAWGTALGAVINVFMNLFLIPRYGGVGAAWATVISYACAGYFSGLIIPAFREVFVWQTKGLLFYNLFNGKRK